MKDLGFVRVGSIVKKIALADPMTNAKELVKMIRKANARGGKDNISVAYLKKESGDL